MGGYMTKTVEKDENLETDCLIWLDASVNSSQENIQAQQQLRTSIDHLLTFDDDQQCLQHIHSLPKNDRVVLMVSEAMGRIIVPQIAQFEQITSIYVYCTDREVDKQWTQQFPKIKDVITQLDVLIHQIQTDRSRKQHQKIDEVLIINVFNSDVQSEEQSSTGLNGQFIHSQLLIDCLIRMKSSSNERQEFLTFCKQEYKKNPAELQIVREFERDYSSKLSLWWYTRQSFLYRLLNKALRMQNIDLLYLFRFFIRDLGQELENNKCASRIHVYRAQQMSKGEIEMLQKSVGEYISMSSFLSTSFNRELARAFVVSAARSNDIGQVFFEIDADPRLDNIKPFADITSLSYFPKEEEVLFMIGSIFRLVEMKCDSDGIWNIRMILCSQNDNQLQSLFRHMKSELGIGETNLQTLGHILYTMGELDNAENYLQLHIDQLSKDHPDIPNCYYALGTVADAKGNYDSSLKWYNKSLKILMQTVKPDHPKIATSYNSIGEAHRKKGDYTRALESYEKALQIRRRMRGDDDLHVAMCLNNMGCTYLHEKKYSKALECHEKALTIQEKYLPADHPDLSASHTNIGATHRCLGHYKEALEHFNLSLKIKSKSLPPQHPSIGGTFKNIGLVYEMKDDFQQALFYFEKASKIFRHSLSSTHPNVITIEQDIKRVSSKLK